MFSRIFNLYYARMESIFVAILQIIKIDCSIKSFHYIYIPLNTIIQKLQKRLKMHPLLINVCSSAAHILRT